MRKLLIVAVTVAFVFVLAIVVSAAAPLPTKPSLDYDFSKATTIDGFNPPSQLYINTDERVLLTDGNGGYVTYPTYYVTKDSDTFDMDFSKLNEAQSVEYSKKSVIMLEIPDGVKAVSQSYFAGKSNFPLCVSVQVPGSVTSYGAYMFQTNTVIKAIEFLDGKEPVTMGDGMFGSNWAEGTTVLEYVRFPNNLVSIGKGTFGKSHASKTVIFGANLTSIGTGFFGESTPSSKDTFLYVSDSFFADTSTMFVNLFGSEAHYHNNHLRLTIFYTGSQEKAQAIIDKGVSIDSGYIWSKSTLISASEYDYETHNPTTNKSVTFVYGFEKCDAFYDGHSYTGEENVVSDNYLEAIRIGDACVNCGKETIVHTIAPIFTWKGYSACTYGDTYAIVQGFAINEESINAYLEYAPSFNYGILATVNTAGEAITPKVGDGNVLSESLMMKQNDYVDIKITGIPVGYEDTRFVFCVYVTEGEDIYYLNELKTEKSVVGASYNDVLISNG